MTAAVATNTPDTTTTTTVKPTADKQNINLFPAPTPVVSDKLTVGIDRPGGPISLAYEIHGYGPNKLLLGLSTTCRSWDSSLRFLLPTGDYTVLVVDNRGSGDSTQPGAGYTIKDMALDIIELMNHLNWTENVFLAGVSMGGMISQELLLNTPPGTFASAALLSTHAGGATPPLATITYFLKKRLLSTFQTPLETSTDLAHLIFGSQWLSTRPLDPTLRSHFPTNFSMIVSSILNTRTTKPLQTSQGLQGQLQAISTHNTFRRLSHIKKLGIPMCCYVGTEDKLIRPENSVRIAREVGCGVEVYPGVGHAVALETPFVFHEHLMGVFRSAKGFVTKGGRGLSEVTMGGGGEELVGGEEAKVGGDQEMAEAVAVVPGVI
ncbi:hypothetical protein HDV05_007341 [Chytridiales sp. JEL 0842]|nr:hypothetical protein HDV05_007341 [Chytridiales sp. JEL 0842]